VVCGRGKKFRPATINNNEKKFSDIDIPDDLQYLNNNFYKLQQRGFNQRSIVTSSQGEIHE
jgi:hypothetical protein